MHDYPHHILRYAFVILALSITTACGSTAAPSDNVPLAAVPHANPTAPLLTASPVRPTPSLPPTFTLYQTSMFQLGLPPGWRARDLATIASDPLVQQLDRKLPPLTRVVSASVALPISYGWAGQSADPASVAPSVIIQGIPLDLRHDVSLRKLPITIHDLFHQPGVTTDQIERGLVIDHYDAAKLRSIILLDLNGSKPTEVQIYHYLIHSERTLWVLTYLIDAHQFAQLNPLILQSAKSFHSLQEADGS
jgi:hypothetical protein